MKNNKGITLIALVITIIVLLILAGVTIAMLSGEDGILNKASKSKVINEVAAVKDEISLAATNAVTDYYEKAYVTSDATKPADVKAAVTAVVKSSNTKVTVSEVAADGTFTITSTEDTSVSTKGTVGEKGGITWDDANLKTGN